MMKRVLVTGSSGFLGVSVCKEFEISGYVVNTFDISEGQDILCFEQVVSALEGQDICIHLAAVADLYNADLDPEQCKNINVNGTSNIAQACRKTGVRLLYASTCCAYGNNGVAISDEYSPVAPTELYAETKLRGERVIEESGCDYNLLRLATFYGPLMRKSLATSVFLEKNISGQVIEIHGDGNQTRCYTHVEDIASGICIVAGNTNAPRVINISDDIPYSVNELVNVISGITKLKPEVKHVEDRVGQIRSSIISANILKNLGWKPRWNLSTGLTDCFNKLNSRGFLS